MAPLVWIGIMYALVAATFSASYLLRVPPPAMWLRVEKRDGFERWTRDASVLFTPRLERYNPYMAADTWATIMLVDRTDTKVLAEGVVGLQKGHDGKYALAEPPVELAIVQEGIPAFVVLRNLKGEEVSRGAYRSKHYMQPGDAVRLKGIH